MNHLNYAFALLLSLSAGAHAASGTDVDTTVPPDIPATTSDKPPTLDIGEPNPSQPAAEKAKDMCYSARDCSGKVLNNRDAHNCKNSGGKSWRSGTTGQCTNL
ncbi:hypothetical protein [Pseudomonas mangiferae]|uniref:DUF3761 domain-containing protein n=1 Tax=Pseudomonas mangiferae TaxID=2593654 RepID=A0A553H4P9_9PSED|nr:hypothetical protein [Pseudomonas mangiferae]TRX76738.1 hypothetical protein FM069_01585 [Pseudomonas mangiferae]